MKRILFVPAVVMLTVHSLGLDARKITKAAVHQVVEIPQVTPRVIPVETDDTQLVLKVQDNGTLQNFHYGMKISDPGQFMDLQTLRGEAPGEGPQAYPATGGRFIQEPALHIKYADGHHNTELYYTGHEVTVRQGVTVTTVHMKDYCTLVEVDLVYEAYPKENVIVAHSEILNGGKDPIVLLNYASSCMVVDADRYLLTHLYGGWANEMQVDRELLTHDTKVIESRRGTQVTQTNNPSFMLSLNTSEFSETKGEVIAGALEWSGNFRLSFEMGEDGRVNVLCGINPYCSEYSLQPGKTFTTPGMIWTFSAEGAGGASRNLHRWARNHGVYGGGSVNPTLLNSWEGAYFNFTTKTLTDMIDDAASMGLEMFVLDDGWFAKDYPRNADNAGLGDWEVNTDKLPEGIDYVASYAHSKGLRFGIWIEPEMVNPESNLAHAHPDWVVRSPGREIQQSRSQWVLDLSNPDVQDFVYDVFDRTMQLSPSIDYIKWDCNRTVLSFGSDYLGTGQDRFYIEYCQGLYDIMRRIRAKYPDVTIQCCSSGGGRVDYGALRYFNEIWTSDNTDALSRVDIQYATSLIYPACVMASHVSAVPNHQSGNVTPLKFRFDIACAGRLGMELQPKNLSTDERALADRCIRSYKQYRDLVFGGDLYRLASPCDGTLYSLMYVSPDKSRAVLFAYNLKYPNRAVGGRSIRLAGLDPTASYKVTELNVESSCWWGSGKSFKGDFLMSGGFNPAYYRLYDSSVFLIEAE